MLFKIYEMINICMIYVLVEEKNQIHINTYMSVEMVNVIAKEH